MNGIEFKKKIFNLIGRTSQAVVIIKFHKALPALIEKIC